MAHINNQLGIPIGHKSDGLGFANASGRGWSRTKKIFMFAINPLAGAAYLALTPNDKSRYKTVMGNISSPPQHLVKDYYNKTKAEFPFSESMTSDQLQSVIDKLTTNYNRWDVQRDSKAASVARNRKALDKGDNKQTIAELAAVRSWMQAINDYRAEAVKAYNKAFAREEKAALDAAAEAEKATTTSKPPIGGSPASLPPNNSGITTPTTEVGGIIDGGTSTAGDTDSKKKTMKMVLYGVGSIVVVGVLYAVLKKQ